MTLPLDPALVSRGITTAITGDQLVYVVDSSNIEARMLAWEAGHSDLLRQFRDKEDVYSNFACSIYNRPINKYDNPLERHVGKTCVLGLGYQVGWRKLQASLMTDERNPVVLDDIESQRIVKLYRAVNAPIPDYWRQAEAAIIDMYLGNERQWGPLRIYKNCLVMPNGLALQYPGLRPAEAKEDGTVAGGWEYWNGKFWTNLYGGKLCLAKGTQVLTRAGWTNIEEIAPNTEVWDGLEWVSCDGNVYNGDKLVVELAGVAMTPDHEVLTDEGWKTASQSQGHNRAESRLPDGDGVRWQQWEEIPVADNLRMRQHQDTARDRADQDAEARDTGLLRLQETGKHLAQSDHARDVEAPGLRRLALDDRPLHPADAPSLAQLRREGGQSLPALEGVVRSLLGRHGGDLPVGADAGSHQQRAALLPGELPLGDLLHTDEQSPDQRADQWQDDQTAIGRIGGRTVDPLVSPEQWLALGQAATPTQKVQPVYDLINCGPRNRFVVRDGSGNPLIVHNCENITQALSRIVLFGQMLKINRLFLPHHGRVVLNVHDEIIAVGPSFGARFLGHDDKGKEVWDRTEGAKALFGQMVEIMRTPPEWCADLPLDGEGGFSFEYSK